MYVGDDNDIHAHYSQLLLQGGAFKKTIIYDLRTPRFALHNGVRKAETITTSPFLNPVALEVERPRPLAYKKRV